MLKIGYLCIGYLWIVVQYYLFLLYIKTMLADRPVAWQPSYNTPASVSPFLKERQFYGFLFSSIVNITITLGSNLKKINLLIHFLRVDPY